jgi:hypothetical protein
MQYAQIGLFDADASFARRNGNHSTVSCTPMMNTPMVASWSRSCRSSIGMRCACAGLPELRDDARFRDQRAALCRTGADRGAVRRCDAEKTRLEWTGLLRAAGVPCGPERDYAEVVRDESLYEPRPAVPLPQGQGTSLQVRMPLEFETTQRAFRAPSSALAEAGLSVESTRFERTAGERALLERAEAIAGRHRRPTGRPFDAAELRRIFRALAPTGYLASTLPTAAGGHGMKASSSRPCARDCARS